MDAMADTQTALDESTEDWLRNERMEGGVRKEQREQRGGWSSEG